MVVTLPMADVHIRAVHKENARAYTAVPHEGKGVGGVVVGGWVVTQTGILWGLTRPRLAAGDWCEIPKP